VFLGKFLEAFPVEVLDETDLLGPYRQFAGSRERAPTAPVKPTRPETLESVLRSPFHTIDRLSDAADDRNLSDPPDERKHDRQHDEYRGAEQDEPPARTVSPDNPMIPTMLKRKAPMNTDMDVCARLSSTMSGTALGDPDWDAFASRFTSVDSAKTVTVSMLAATMLRMLFTASCETVIGRLPDLIGSVKKMVEK
jgi:hypothetical protein